MTCPGPCNLCGAKNYSLSLGGPYICPSCDCGNPPKQAGSGANYFMPNICVNLNKQIELKEEIIDKQNKEIKSIHVTCFALLVVAIILLAIFIFYLVR